MKKKLGLFSGVLAVFVALVCAAEAAAAGPTFTIKDRSGRDLAVVTREADNLWTATVEGKKFTLDGTKSGELKFVLPDGTALPAVRKGEKVELRTPSGAVLLVKIRPDKIKVSLGKDEKDPWEFKLKEDRIKIVRSDTKLGKVRYYPDRKQLKAKDADETVVARCDTVTKTSAVLAPFVLGDALSLQDRMFLVLLFFSLDR